MGSQLEGRQRDPVFQSLAAPTVLLGADFVIRAVTPSYLAATGRQADELLYVNVFDAFPENPATPDVGSARSLTDAVESVLRTGRANQLAPLRYDIPDPARPGEYVEKRWVLVNSPVRDGDDVVGTSIQVQDVTLVDEHLVDALREYRDVLADGDQRTSAARERVDVVSSFLALIESHDSLAGEVSQLRQALASRPTIDQAKGVIMADRGCTPDEAFQLLRKLSMDTNVRVADVAAAIVYQVRKR